jgi:hypothetical protein
MKQVEVADAMSEASEGREPALWPQQLYSGPSKPFILRRSQSTSVLRLKFNEYV